MSSVPRPTQVPTLTEVVEFEATEPVPLGWVPPVPAEPPEEPPVAVAPAAVPSAAPTVPDVVLPEASGLDTKTLVERVLADVQRQLDKSLDYRLREALTPALVRLADGFVRETRAQLTSTLRDAVTKAVNQELERQRRR